MAYYHICPNCGSNLDPGETCDCSFGPEEKQNEADYTARGGESFGNIFEAAGREVPRGDYRLSGVG